MSGKLNLRIRQGGTYRKPFRWEAEPFIYRQITGISNSAPCNITCVGHGLLPDQLFTVQAVKGLTELNEKVPLTREDWRRATVVDADHIQINRVNSSEFKAYISGGNIRYRSVADLTGYTATMQIKDKIGGNVLYTLSTALGNLVIDPVLQLISIVIPDEVTATFNWKKGVYDIQLESPAGISIPYLHGEVFVSYEVTTG